jgi:transposase-like protein
MKTVIDREIRTDIHSAGDDSLLSTSYPSLYCPRCGSYEIGLRRLIGDSAVWGCRDCNAMFTLDFPHEKRF